MLQSLGGPMVGMMQQMGVPQADRAQVLVQEVVLPVLSSRYEDLLAIQAKAFASVLSVDNMKGALAFYNTPTGQNLIRAQPQLAQLKLTGMTQWIGGLQPGAANPHPADAEGPRLGQGLIQGTGGACVVRTHLLRCNKRGVEPAVPDPRTLPTGDP